MVGVVDEMGAVAVFLPPTVTVANGDVIKIDVHPAKEYHRQAPYPYLTFERSRSGSRLIRSKDILEPEEISSDETATPTYQTGQDVYRVTERDIVAVTELLATVGGVDDTELDEGTDFEIYTTPGLFGPDAIRFLPGGTAPDAGTPFTLSYTARRLSRMHQMIVDQTWRLELHTKDLKRDADIPVPADRRGATVSYVKSYLAQQLADGLAAFLDTNRGKNLVTADPVRGTQFRVVEVQDLGELPVDEGESLVRWGFDLVLRRRRLTAVGSDRTIIEVETPDLVPP